MKERLAGNKVSIEAVKLRSGIEIGETIMKDVYEGEFSSVNGRSLLNNPFFKVGKKKKKKKKKK